MALWDRISSRGNVEDRRGMAPVVGGLGLTGVALYFLFSLLTGSEIDMSQVLNQLENTQLSQQPLNADQFAGEDDYEVFASTVLGSSDNYWDDVLAKK